MGTGTGHCNVGAGVYHEGNDGMEKIRGIGW
jgi:hypothetical protein